MGGKGHSLSVRQKIILSVGAVSLTVIIIGFFLASIYFLSLFRNNMRDNALAQARIISASIAVPLAAASKDEVSSRLDEMIETFPTVANVSVYNRRGHFFSMVSQDGSSQIIFQSIHNLYIEGNDLYVYTPVLHEGEVCGSLYLKVETGIVPFIYKLSGILILLAVILFFVACLLAKILEKFISAPIKNLTAIAKEVTDKHNYGVRTISGRNDEFGDLSNNFNKLLELLSAQEKERDIAQEEVAAREEKFMRLFEESNDAVFFIREKYGDILDVNYKACEMLGYNKHILQRMKILELHPEEERKKIRNVFNAIGECGSVVLETKLLHKNGTHVWVEIHAKIVDAEHNVIQGVARDITTVKQSESSLEKALEKAHESDRLKSAFFGIMSHEIRTPLNSILGYADLAFRENNDREIADYLMLIQGSGKSLLKLINDMLDLSLIEAKQLKLKKEPFSLVKVFENVKRKTQNMLATTDQVFLDCQMPHDKIIIGDAKRLEQVLLNLVTNAIKFTFKGTIAYGVTFGVNTLTFYVEDTGVGIPEDKIEKVFNLFTQVDNRNVRTSGGAGLGLSISKKLVECMGGEMTVKSSQGSAHGTVFKFTHPFVDAVLFESEMVDDMYKNLPKPPASETEHKYRLF